MNLPSSCVHRLITLLFGGCTFLFAVTAISAELNSIAVRSFEAGDGAGGSESGSESGDRRYGASWDDPVDSIGWTVALDYRYPLTGDYRSIYVGRLMMEASGGPHGLGISIGGGSVHLKSGSRAAEGAHDPAVFEVALHYRLYFTHAEATLRPYGAFMLGTSTFYWSYRQDPISGGERISSDAALGFNGCVGMGLLYNVTESFQLFAEMGYGGIGFLETTASELKNELFDSFGYVSITGGVGWRF